MWNELVGRDRGGSGRAVREGGRGSEGKEHGEDDDEGQGGRER